MSKLAHLMEGGFLLYKPMWTGAFCLAIAVGLSGCSNQQAAENENFRDTTASYGNEDKNQLVQNLSSHDQELVRNDNLGTLNDKNEAYPKKDINYHRHLSKPFNPKSTYYTSYQGELVDRINQQVHSIHHVKDARSIITKDDVIVSVLLDDHREEKNIKKEITDKIKPYLQNRTIHITTDESNFHRTMRFDNRLRRGDTENMRNWDAADYFNGHENTDTVK